MRSSWSRRRPRLGKISGDTALIDNIEHALYPVFRNDIS